MPAEPNSCTQASADYFAKRRLRRYAGVASLWAIGVGAVISGHYSGWNLGLLAGGIVLRMRRPRLARPYRSPLGVVGAPQA